ncbi:MAG TPA: Rv2578c family radical SAM protein [Nakamurella sp.]|jgi:DNA repair photolyase|nr:Rv2578c family radical SAM protein [Nakamurella sp.]
MRWQQQELTAEHPEALPGLGRLAGLVRTVRTPEFAGVTFHEVHCRSALNKVPGASPMPFTWTINPYRGCTHACRYCFARRTHEYLEFDAGRDFDTQIVVKTNIGRVLRRELGRPSWSGEHVAMGTNTDPYQRAEGRYALMPEIIRALADSGTPFSILTKGTVLSRDLPLLAAANRTVPVGVGVSLALLDPQLQSTLEPGTPSPQARLTLIRRITEAGLPCGVFIAPVLPYLTDSEEQLTALVRAIAEAGATGISGIALHLRPGAREWFFGWLQDYRPDLVPRYRELYAGGSNLRKELRGAVTRRVREICDGLGLGSFGQDVRGVPGSAESRFPDGSLPRRDAGREAGTQPSLF